MKQLTMAWGKRWRISRLTEEGHEKYPDFIDVGGIAGPIVRYEPTYTAWKLKTGFSGQIRCSQCSIFNPKENNYCRRCGARFEEVDG